ncbi:MULTISPECIES: Ldh family oxidoreductase [unclassified Polynucleobacter]|jgi:LDH2 family malate/lactate/ureidoglycolate dehydrogenase|uniref:Ldh family oxidoreductase n=1 Tax=unclassified Polynucleobacter TaxID=2640945 RepID=UPI002572B357|nr:MULTISPECIES: Ldh family oxidoreductase [unclassified Polynucleobacter]BEI43331.1 Ldh family oxidoreductase [Polynucleobacter sp. HIN10]BEI45107.1 Ldh family oxidoreductase [Polynucleobacter sp. HIN11]
MTSLFLPVGKAQEFISNALIANQIPYADALLVADLMIQSDLVGADGHGIFRLPAYIKRIRAGGINLRPNIHVERDRGAVTLINGDNALGHLVMARSVEHTIEKAKNFGVAWTGSHHGNHSGAASVYVRKIAEAGLVGIYMAVGNANHMAPWGGIDLLLSTNPIAIAVPAKDHPIVLLDIATTVAAYGKIKLAAQKGESIPVGWMIDKKGSPITNPSSAAEGSLLPIGGYKGYGLALMIGLLAGSLNGAAVGKETIDFNAHHDLITNTGQAMIAVDPAAFGNPEDFIKRVTTVVMDIKKSSKLPGVNEIRIPGEGAARVMEQRLKFGIPISQELLSALNKCASESGVSTLNL